MGGGANFRYTLYTAVQPCKAGTPSVRLIFAAIGRLKNPLADSNRARLVQKITSSEVSTYNRIRHTDTMGPQLINRANWKILFEHYQGNNRSRVRFPSRRRRLNGIFFSHMRPVRNDRFAPSFTSFSAVGRNPESGPIERSIAPSVWWSLSCVEARSQTLVHRP